MKMTARNQLLVFKTQVNFKLFKEETLTIFSFKNHSNVTLTKNNSNFRTFSIRLYGQVYIIVFVSMCQLR